MRRAAPVLVLLDLELGPRLGSALGLVRPLVEAGGRVVVLCGESAAPLFLIYIWVTLGSGFRFGAKYLVSELAMSVAGFALAIYLNAWWREHTALAVRMCLDDPRWRLSVQTHKVVGIR